MELLIITAARAFEKDIIGLLKKAGVKTFSYMDVTGYKGQEGESMSSNWFASSIGERQSVLFYAFVPMLIVDEVMLQIRNLNESQESESKIHVAVIDIKRMNNI